MVFIWLGFISSNYWRLLNNNLMANICEKAISILDEITHSTMNPKCSVGDNSGHNLHHHQPPSHQVNHI